MAKRKCVLDEVAVFTMSSICGYAKLHLRRAEVSIKDRSAFCPVTHRCGKSHVSARRKNAYVGEIEIQARRITCDLANCTHFRRIAFNLGESECCLQRLELSVELNRVDRAGSVLIRIERHRLQEHNYNMMPAGLARQGACSGVPGLCL